MRWTLPLLALPLLATLLGAQSPLDDLVIVRARVLDVRTGHVATNRTVRISHGVIRAIEDAGPEPAARKRIDAHDRLLTPGLIDVHHHTSYVLGDSLTPGGGIVARLVMKPDSIVAYRRRFAAAYLPYGVTTVREAGGDDRYAAMMQAWMHSVPWAPDDVPVGGALVTHEEGRVPYRGHAEVRDPTAARAKVDAYHRLGFTQVKLYWRLKEPEFRAAADEARKLGMTPFAHVDFNVFTIRGALDAGVRDFEHVYTLAKEVLSPDQQDSLWQAHSVPLLGTHTEGLFLVTTMDLFHALPPGDPRMEDLLADLKRVGASVTPTLHVFAGPLGLAWFRSPSLGPFDDIDALPEAEIESARAGYSRMAAWTKRLWEQGTRLQLGTDTREPGKSALSEMLLLHDAGIPMADVFRIATLNGAEQLGMARSVGAVERGYRANLVLFDADPLADSRALLGGRTVIKDGVVFEGGANER